MKLSVITINLNNLAGLKKTVDSVLFQTCHDFEYIIIDGASTDGSAEYVKQLSSDRMVIKTLTEPDSGVYSAMNKGLRMAEGEYVHFLNSGDFLMNGNVYTEWMHKSAMTADVVYGNKIDVYPDGHEVLNLGLQKSNLTFDDAYKGCIPHTSAFTKRSLFDRFGMFDESYQVVSDTEFYLKSIGLGGCSTEYVDVTVSFFDMAGISKNAESQPFREIEFEEMKRKTLSSELVDAYEFAQKYGYKINRINKKKWSAFLFRILNRLAYTLNG